MVEVIGKVRGRGRGRGRGFVLVIVFVLLIVGCEKVVEPLAFSLPPEAAELIESGNDFGLELFKNILADAESDENVMISPLSVSLALSMAYNGAEGETKIQMEEVMKMTGLSVDQINDLNKKLVAALLAHDASVTLEIANSIWYRNDFTVRPDFIGVNQKYYDAEVSSLDFTDPDTKDVINGWVADKTHDKIMDIVDQISPESFMFLINAIYFKGNWKWEFDPKSTYEGAFYVTDDETVPVSMMRQELNLNTLNNELFSAIELPYGKGNWSMFIFLPRNNVVLDELTDELDSDKWDSWMSGFSPSKEVDITIPAFTFEYETSLKKALISMGMEDAFTSAANFNGILEGGGLQVSDVKHKTFIEVNEEGTEAAAVTSVEIELTSVGNYFNANRPFLFVIVEKSSNTILFSGRLSNPS